MDNLLSYLRILKIGATKTYFPIFAQYLHSKDGWLSTYNLDVYIRVRFPAIFEGDINIYTLEKTISALRGDSAEYNTYGNTLQISCGTLVTKLMLEDMEFPSMEEPVGETTIITEEAYEVIEEAMKYVGGEYPYVIVSNGIYSTNGSKAYYNNTKCNLTVPISKEVFALLSVGDEVGVEGTNTFIKFSNIEGFALFNLFDSSTYPTVQIRDTVATDTWRVCNIAPILDAVSKVTSISYGEEVKGVTISCEDEMLRVEAESAMQGESVYTISAPDSPNFSIYINANFFNRIPLSYDLYVSGMGELNKIFLRNEKTTMIFMGLII